MAMSPNRWKEITPSQFAWEREALEYVRTNLPDSDPYRAWSNFEFIAGDGSINEVDLLIAAPAGFFLVEIKSKPGRLSGDAGTWIWMDDSGRKTTVDNPILLANRKAKKLISLIRSEKAMLKTHTPYLDALVFCSAENIHWNFTGAGGSRICFREKEGVSRSFPGVIAALKERRLPGLKTDRPAISKTVSNALGRAIEALGIRQSQQFRRVGDYVLEELLFQCPKDTYQDFRAAHSQAAKIEKRVRIYNVSRTESEETRSMIQRAAVREFQLHNSLSHEGILKAEHYQTHELGPALIYPLVPGAVRLDHYLSQYHETLSVDIRLSLIRRIAEAVRYAHGKRVVHRALSPYCILVENSESNRPGVKILNWQTGRRTQDGFTDGSSHSGTIHPDLLAEDLSLLYMAPEAIRATNATEPSVDVFSLGAVAYHIFAGRPPAGKLVDLIARLGEQRGLDISLDLDGVGRELRNLIKYATNPDVLDRWPSADDFLDQLQLVEEELTRPEDNAVANPLDASIGDILEGGFKVDERLGKGGSATVFLVEDARGAKQVLKLANNQDINERLAAEYDTLKKIKHPQVVEAYSPVKVSGLQGFTMQRAGDKTVARRIQEEGPFQLEFLKRFGDDLLAIAEHLEDLGIFHRDIKPDNIGIGSIARKTKLRLFLFDFSLAAVPLDAIRAGTLKYHDPFLCLRKPVQWDVYAERFCVAMTLYEMATGLLPVWGDGVSAPEIQSCEATLACEAFDAHVRNPMTDFFKKAFRRNYTERFDNSEEMRAAWNQIFFEIQKPRTPSVHPDAPLDRENAIRAAAHDTQLVSLGLTPQALSALERINAATVEDLLRIPYQDFRYLKGAGQETRKEITRLARDLHRANPDFKIIQPSRPEPDAPPEPGFASVDRIADEIGKTGKPDVKPVLQAFSALDRTDGALHWPAGADIAARFKLKQKTFAQILAQARNSWRRSPEISKLREDMAFIIEKHGGLVSMPDLAAAVLAARGSALEDPARIRAAVAVCRAAVEAEQGNQEPRFFDRRCPGKKDGVLALNTAELGPYAQKLGAEADRLAVQEPLAAPIKAIETLRAVEPPGTAGIVLNDNDLLKIAVYSSSGAALSSRLEIYPVNMPALRMLRLSQGTLAGVRELTVDEIHQRITGRFSRGETPPGRPELDELLKQAGLDMVWKPDAAGGEGAYVHRRAELTLDTTGSFTGRAASVHGEEPPLVTPEEADARIFDRKLKRAAEEGAYLVLTVPGKYLERARTALIGRFNPKPVDFDELFIPILKKKAEEHQADWNVVLKADASPKNGTDWRNLNLLVSMCMPAVEEQLAESGRTLLLTGVGLLARYNRMNLLESLRDRIGVTGGALEGLWLLIPADESNPLPAVDGAPVPLLGSGQHARIPGEWIRRSNFKNGK